MLTLTARTSGKPLVIANVLNTDPVETIKITDSGSGKYVAGKTGNTPFAFSQNPGESYTVNGITTDALALTWEGDRIFAADVTTITKGGKLLLRSSASVVCEILGNTIKYNSPDSGTVMMGAVVKPSEILVNGKKTKFTYNKKLSEVSLMMKSGDSVIEIIN
jgi:hypothetical protein